MWLPSGAYDTARGTRRWQAGRKHDGSAEGMPHCAVPTTRRKGHAATSNEPVGGRALDHLGQRSHDCLKRPRDP
eukprot:8137018-Alexandrium_andersonii.AAC.1